MSTRRADCPYSHAGKVDGKWWKGEYDEFGLIYLSSGVMQVKARCLECNARSGAIPQDVYTRWGVEPSDLPVWTPPRTDITCVVTGCETPGHEYHHFAPSAVFGEDAWLWPCLPLCQPHHVEWHQRMNGYRWGRPQ